VGAEELMYIGRRDDGTIYGQWTVQQWEGQEELPDDDPEVVAFLDEMQRMMDAGLQNAHA
jgi:hypothetical protein